MKIVIRRHQADYHVFRALALAQALAELLSKPEVSIECFQSHTGPLTLAPKIGWKNPHHPFEVSERVFKRGDGTDVVRKGGKLYDHVIDIDGDGPFESRWNQSGLNWWDWVLYEARLVIPHLHVARFPNIETVTDSKIPAGAGKYVILAPLAEESDPRHINVNHLEAHAKKLFPGLAIFWLSPGHLFLGPGRDLVRWESYPDLAGILHGAAGVFAVNGLVAALAQSTYRDRPLAKKFAFVRGVPLHAQDRDPFAKMRAKIDTEPKAGVLGVHPQSLEINEVSALPAD